MTAGIKSAWSHPVRPGYRHHGHSRAQAPDQVISEAQMMFLDCPAYLDEDGARRCGLPAEVRRRFILRSSDGPVEAAMIRCPSGHWFNGPIEFLTWDGKNSHDPGTAGAMSSPAAARRPGRRDTDNGKPAHD